MDDNTDKIEEARAESEEAHESLDAARDAVLQAEAQLQEAQNELQRLTDYMDSITAVAAEMSQLYEATSEEYAARQARIESLAQDASSRLQHAQQVLTEYLESNPDAAFVATWLGGESRMPSVLNPRDIGERMHLSAPMMQHLIEYQSAHDLVFRAKLDEYRVQLKNCNGTAEKLQVQQKVRKYMSGYMGEAMVYHAFRPYAEKVETQKRTYFDDGRYTKADIVVKGLKVPIILGRGENRYVPVGGSLGIEVKCGQANYLYSQKEHLVFQSGGHKEESAAVTICSRNIKDLADEKEKELREELKAAGSPMLGMLPRKEEIDEACWNYINGSRDK